MPKAHRGRPATNAAWYPSAPEPGPVAAQPEAPATSDSKAKWVAFAEAVGADSTGTKQEIIARLS